MHYLPVARLAPLRIQADSQKPTSQWSLHITAHALSKKAGLAVLKPCTTYKQGEGGTRRGKERLGELQGQQADSAGKQVLRACGKAGKGEGTGFTDWQKPCDDRTHDLLANG